MTVTGSSAQTEVTEREARQVAEQARETDWRKPSFGKELFLGRFRLDLIHPHPTGRIRRGPQRGEAFLARLRDFCETKIDAAVIERRRGSPTRWSTGSRSSARSA